MCNWLNLVVLLCPCYFCGRGHHFFCHFIWAPFLAIFFLRIKSVRTIRVDAPTLYSANIMLWSARVQHRYWRTDGKIARLRCQVKTECEAIVFSSLKLHSSSHNCCRVAYWFCWGWVFFYQITWKAKLQLDWYRGTTQFWDHFDVFFPPVSR